MKTQILLICFLCIFACSLQAQNPNHQAILPFGPERVGNFVKPTQPGFKLDHMVVPAKRNMFNHSNSIWKWDTILCFDTVHGEPSQRLSRKFNFSGDSIIQLTERRQGNLLWENFTRETFLYDSSGNMLTYLLERWINNGWENISKREYAYTLNGDPLERKYLTIGRAHV